MYNCTYANYIRTIEQLQEMIDISPENPEIKLKLNYIFSILSQREGPSALDALLNYDLKERLISIYFDYKEAIDLIFDYIFIRLHFKNDLARTLKSIFVPNCISYDAERTPTKSEELYMEIIILSNNFDNFQNNEIKDKNFLNNFPQRLQYIKNVYLY